MGTVLGSRPIRGKVETGEAKNKSDQRLNSRLTIVGKGSNHQPAIVDGSQQDMGGNDLCFTARPNLALEFLDQDDLFWRF